MKVSYKVKEEDIVTFNLWHLKTMPKLVKTRNRSRLLVSGFYGAIGVGFFAFDRSYWAFSWILIFLAVMWALFYPRVWERRLRKKVLKALKGREDHGVHSLEFEDEGVVAKNDIKEGWIPWENILRIVETGEHIFLYITEDNAVIVPREGLDDEEEWNELCEEVREYAEVNGIVFG